MRAESAATGGWRSRRRCSPTASGPRLSRDGKQVAFAAATPGSRGRDIYVADLTNVSAPRKAIANATFRVFSPDGQWIAFGSLGTTRENGEEALFMQRAEAPASRSSSSNLDARRRIGSRGIRASPSSLWLPDGRLVFEHDGNIATISTQAGTQPTFSTAEQHPISGVHPAAAAPRMGRHTRRAAADAVS